MVREYIGARYVPKFMGTFDVTQSYEALCVVDNGSGTSYISKIPTPPGTSLTDPTYWALYGASSGAIINLQDQIDALSATLKKTKSTKEKHIVILGDSYADTSPTDFAYLIAGWDIFKQVDIVAAGGRGFTGKDGTSEYNVILEWKTALTNYVNSHTADELADVDEVYICGGFNDHYSTQAVIESHIEDFFNYANVNLPCEYFLIENGWCSDHQNITTPVGTFTSASIRAAIANKVIPAYASAAKFGCHYLGNVVYALHDYKNSWNTGDYYHPSIQGGEDLAYAILNLMLGRETTPILGTQHLYVDGAVASIGSVRIYKDTITFMGWGTRFFAYADSAVTAHNDVKIAGTTFADDTRYIAARDAYPKNYIPCQIQLDDNTVHISYMYIAQDGSLHILAPIDLATTDRMRVQPLTTTLSILDC